MSDWFVVVGAALVFACVSFAITRVLGNRRRVKQIQKEINDYNAELRKAAESKDESRIKAAAAREGELTKLTWEMMSFSFKPLLVILPLFWIAYSWVLPAIAEPTFMVQLPFSVPSSLAFWQQWKDYLGSRGLFIYSLVVIGLVLEFVSTNVLKLDG